MKHLIKIIIAVMMATSLIPIIGNDESYAYQTTDTEITPLTHVDIPQGLAVDMSNDQVITALTAARTYISLSIDSWNAQVSSAYWEEQNNQMQQKLQLANQKAAKAQQAYIKAKKESDDSNQAILEWQIQNMQDSENSLDPALATLLSGPENFSDAATIFEQKERITQGYDDIVKKAEKDKENALAQQKKAQKAQSKADSDATKAQEYLVTSQTNQEKAEKLKNDSLVQWTNIWKSLSTVQKKEPANTLSLGTKIFNIALIEQWNKYLDEINNTHIAIPTIHELLIPSDYPKTVAQPQVINKKDSIGISRYGVLIIPSRESIIRTSTALTNLGQNYQSDGDGTSGWNCDNFISHLTQTPGTLPQNFETAGQQNANIFDTASGDIVFFSDSQSGIHQGGIYVLGGFVINASAASGNVSVDTIGVDALGSVRPGTPNTDNKPAPPRIPGSLEWKCGSVAYTGDSSMTSQWTQPIPEGLYTISTPFATNDVRFNGTNPGTEFTAATGQNIVADFNGIVTELGQDAVWGTYITISHAEGLTTRYSSLATTYVTLGTTVTAGTVLGTVGNTGSATNTFFPNVLVTIVANNENINPENVFFPSEISQYPNGQIPVNALCPIFNGNGYLRCDAARALSIMNSAYRAETGNDLSITDTYRTFAEQVQCRAEKGDICAVPGTSNHGWGLAIDFGGGIQDFNSPAHQWMVDNAAKYGWYHPDWAEEGGNKPEPWHWEYVAAK